MAVSSQFLHNLTSGFHIITATLHVSQGLIGFITALSRLATAKALLTSTALSCVIILLRALAFVAITHIFNHALNRSLDNHYNTLRKVLPYRKGYLHIARKLRIDLIRMARSRYSVHFSHRGHFLNGYPLTSLSVVHISS